MTGKILEKILAERLLAHIGSRGGLAKSQFGFLKGRSTCDAIKAARDFADSHTKNGGHCIAVSLNIRNAFNSLKCGAIRRALRKLECPRRLYQRDVTGVR